MNIGIIGGGIAGLTAAYELAKRGHEVTVYERGAELGGQAATFSIARTRLERFYHHIFTSDRHIMDLIEELGLSHRLEWFQSKVGFFYDGKIYDFVTPGDLLRFKPLSLMSRLRAGLISLYLQRQANGLKYEGITAALWLRRYAGPEVYRVIWQPLLRGKFGEMADEVSMTWFWGKMRLRFGSRRGLVRESLGYLQGSFQVLIDELARRIGQMGGKIHTATEVQRIIVIDGRAVGLQGTRRGTDFSAYHDAIIATVPSFVFLGLVPDLPEDYANKLRQVRYQAAFVMVLQMKHPLSHIYWLNISDPTIPFVAAIEQTNLIPPAVYDGKCLLYLSNYLSQDDPFLDYSIDKVLTAYLPALQRINHRFDPSWIEEAWLFRDDAGQPVVTCNYSGLIPPYETPIACLYLANTTQIYPEDRGMNYSVRLGQQIARLVGA